MASFDYNQQNPLIVLFLKLYINHWDSKIYIKTRESQLTNEENVQICYWHLFSSGFVHALTKASDTRQADSGWGCKMQSPTKCSTEMSIQENLAFGAFQNSSISNEEVQRHFGGLNLAIWVLKGRTFLWTIFEGERFLQDSFKGRPKDQFTGPFYFQQ